jgi:hypothetical protein
MSHEDLTRDELKAFRKLIKNLLRGGGEEPDEVPEADQAMTAGMI